MVGSRVAPLSRWWLPALSAVVVQGAVLFVSAIYPSSDGGIGAPFAAYHTRCMSCLLAGRPSPPGGLDAAMLVVDVLITVALFAAIAQLSRSAQRATPLPIAAALVAMWVALEVLLRLADAANARRGPSEAFATPPDFALPLWLSALAGYAVGTFALSVLRKRGWG